MTDFLGFTVEFIKLRRQLSFKSNKELGELLNVSPRAIQRWNSGRASPTPSRPVLRKLRSLVDPKKPCPCGISRGDCTFHAV